MKKFIIVMLFIVALISCDNQTSKVDEKNEEGVKIQIQNKTEFEFRDIEFFKENFGNLKPGEITSIKTITNSFEGPAMFTSNIVLKEGNVIELNQIYNFGGIPNQDIKYIIDTVKFLDNNYTSIDLIEVDLD